MSQRQYPHFIRNALCLGLDNALFGASMLFVSKTTVVPSLARQLTDSTVLLGLLSSIATAGWMVPQLLAAHHISGRERVKPYVVWPGLVNRLMLWVTGIGVLFFASGSPQLTLGILLVCQSLLWMGVGVSGLSWLDLFAKVIPPTRRGRVLGVSQALRGVVAILVGFLVGYILDSDSPISFPGNYALLFFGAGLGATISFTAVCLVREPVDHNTPGTVPWREYLPKLWSIVRSDAAFRRVMSVRILIGYSSMAYAFYVIFATENLSLSPAVIGSFTLAQTVGSMVGGFVLGYFNERRGSLGVISLATGASLVIPLVALFTHYSADLLGPSLTYVYLTAFLLIGLVDCSFMLGFMNCLIEIAPPGDRPLYMGLNNTFSAVILLAPLIGGWILRVSTYPVLFCVAAACAALALIPMSALGKYATKNRVMRTEIDG